MSTFLSNVTHYQLFVRSHCLQLSLSPYRYCACCCTQYFHKMRPIENPHPPPKCVWGGRMSPPFIWATLVTQHQALKLEIWPTQVANSRKFPNDRPVIYYHRSSNSSPLLSSVGPTWFWFFLACHANTLFSRSWFQDWDKAVHPNIGTGAVPRFVIEIQKLNSEAPSALCEYTQLSGVFFNGFW